MNTEQMRAEFEAWSLPLEYTTRRNEDNYEDRYTEHAWLVWQACCKKQEDRITESTRELTDLLGGALVALEQREDAPPYPMFSTKAEEILLTEIMELKRKLVSITDEYLNAEADAAKLRQQLADKREGMGIDKTSSKLLCCIPLPDGATLQREYETETWSLYRDDYIRRLNYYECEFINSAIKANTLHDKREFVVELPKAELIGSYLDHPANTRINVYKLPVLETIAAIEAAGGRVK